MREPREIHAKFLAVPAAHENRQNSRGDFYNSQAWWVKWSIYTVLFVTLIERKEKSNNEGQSKKSLYHEIIYQLLHNYYVAFKNWHLRNASQLR